MIERLAAALAVCVAIVLMIGVQVYHLVWRPELTVMQGIREWWMYYILAIALLLPATFVGGRR